MSGSVTPAQLKQLAFDFVTTLARELSEGKIDLPGFPQVFMRVCRALETPDTSAARMASIIGAEPALAARLLAMVNSAAFRESGKPIAQLPAAIIRLGGNNVRSAAAAFALEQVRHAASLRRVAGELQELWERSMHVAAICYVIAQTSMVGADEAFLAGLLHGIGKLYILARMSERSDLLDHAEEIRSVTDGWDLAIGKSLLESWHFPDEIIEAVEAQEDTARRPHPRAEVADVLVCAKALSVAGARPDMIAWHIENNRAFRQLNLDAPRCAAVLSDAAAEIGALRAALGA